MISRAAMNSARRAVPVTTAAGRTSLAPFSSSASKTEAKSKSKSKPKAKAKPKPKAAEQEEQREGGCHRECAHSIQDQRIGVHGPHGV